MTPDEARAEVVNLYEATKEVVGGDWTEDTRTWVACTLPDGTDGAQHLFLALRRQQDLPDRPRAIIERVQSAWGQQGFEVAIESDDTLDPPRLILSAPAWLTGSDQHGRLVQFMVGDRYANFSSNSRCVPGVANDQII